MKILNSKIVTTLLAVAATGFSLNLHASLVTGTYSFDSDPGNQAVVNGDGSFELTSSDTTYSYVDFILNQTVTFSQLTSLSTTFTSHSGGAGGGSPRIVIGLSSGEAVVIYLGPGPNFISDDATLNLSSGVNYIGNTVNGTYDTSFTGLPGSSTFTTYANALSLVGGQQVTDIAVVSDTFGNFPSRDLTVYSIDATYASAVPEPTTIIAGVMMLLPFGLSGLRMALKKRSA